MDNDVSPDRYLALTRVAGRSAQRAALDLALDIRKFEIALYWKRATYFWTLIAAAFVGHWALVTSNAATPDTHGFLGLVVTCLGLVLSLAWYLVNRGSKYWQENWEAHVDVLETAVVGPLYKTTIGYRARDAFHPIKEYPFSVTKVNTWVSLFVTVVWAGLLASAVPVGTIERDWRVVQIIEPWLSGWSSHIGAQVILLATVVCVCVLLLCSRSGLRDRSVIFSRREVVHRKNHS